MSVLTDPFVSPTLNTNLAGMLLEITKRRVTGILHTSGATRVNRYEFAIKLADVFSLNADLIKPAKLDEMPWKAKRDLHYNKMKYRLLNHKYGKLLKQLIICIGLFSS